MADVLANIVVKQYGAFREGSAARSRVTNTRAFGAQITARTREHSGTDIGA
jgi:hypothetical protein